MNNSAAKRLRINNNNNNNNNAINQSPNHAGVNEFSPNRVQQSVRNAIDPQIIIDDNGYESSRGNDNVDEEDVFDGMAPNERVSAVSEPLIKPRAQPNITESLFAKFEQLAVSTYFSEYKRKYTVRSRVEQLTQPISEPRQSDGEKRLNAFAKILATGFSWRPHRFQQDFHREVVKAVAPQLMGSDWDRLGPQIIRERGWKHMARMVMAKGPRRFGKSVAVAMVVIAFAECMPESVQAIFSTGRRASKNLLDICHKFALERQLGPYIEHFNQEELHIRNPTSGKLCKIYSYPANAKISEFETKQQQQNQNPSLHT